MEVLTSEGLRLFIIFVVPGFVASTVYRILRPSAKADSSSQLYQAITLGTANLVLICWLPLWVLPNHTLDDSPWRFALTGVVVLFIGPVMLAYGLAKSRTLLWVRKRFGHPAVTAWDFAFEQIAAEKSSCFVKATLNNGAVVAGFMGKRSHASCFPNRPDIYLQQTWRVEEGGHLGEVIPASRGCYIKAADCMYIEFSAAGEGASNDERQEVEQPHQGLRDR